MEIPESWVNTDIRMIHKKGDPTIPTNYRPIALENTTFKLFTDILNRRLTDWTEYHNVIPEFQNGFRAKSGCIDNIFIINTLIEITTNKKENNALFAVFIDFKGAFDSVDHTKNL
jgi:hypothetical protein